MYYIYNAFNYCISQAQEGSLRKVFLTLPNLNAQNLTPDQVQSVMQRGGVKLNKQEVTTLFRELDRQKFGKVKLTKILKFIVDNTTEI